MTRFLRPRLLSFAVLSAFAFTGCGGPTFDLAELPRRSLHVSVSEEGEGFDVSVALPQPSDECPGVRSDAVAEIDGVELYLLQNGGTYRAFDLNEACAMPNWTTPVDNQIAGRRSSVLRVKDESLTMEVEVEHLLAPRQLSLLGSGVLVPGEEAVLEWSVPTDLLRFDEEDFAIKFISDDEAVLEIVKVPRDQVTLEGTRLRFTVPREMPEGEGRLSVAMSAQPHVVRSSGIEDVEFSFVLAGTTVRTRVVAP